MAYPASYRNRKGQSGYGPGFQRSGAGNFGRNSVGFPANDLRKPTVPPAKKTVPNTFFSKKAGRKLSRAFTRINRLKTVWDVINGLYKERPSVYIPPGSNWTILPGCDLAYKFPWTGPSCWVRTGLSSQSVNLCLNTIRACNARPNAGDFSNPASSVYNGSVVGRAFGYGPAVYNWEPGDQQRRVPDFLLWRPGNSSFHVDRDNGPPELMPRRVDWSPWQMPGAPMPSRRRTSPNPAVDPEAQPIMRPEVQPRAVPRWAVPYRRPNIYRAPSMQSQRGNSVAPLEDFVPRPIGSVISIGPDGVTVASSPPHVRRPPTTREKELKGNFTSAKVGLWYRVVKTGIDNVTEALDFLGLLYDEIPFNEKLKWMRDNHIAKGQKITPLQMGQMVYDLWQHIDPWSAIVAFAEMEVADVFYGYLGRMVGRNVPGGQRGPWDTVAQNMIYEARDRYGNDWLDQYRSLSERKE